MIQPYGINVWGDLLGSVLIVVVWGFMTLCKVPWSWRWRYLIIAFGLSAFGSMQVMGRASYRGDLTVMTYHLVWTIVSLALMVWAWNHRASRA